jgi:hypothetical protein
MSCSKTQLWFSCSRFGAENIFKEINIYVQKIPKIIHRKLPNLSSLVQGPAALVFLRVGLHPGSSFRV